MSKIKYILFFLFLLPSTLVALVVDERIASYQKKIGISGVLNSAGSDTLNNLMSLWTEGFRRLYPSVQTQVEGKGSSTAPPALTEGTAQLGPMSRVMKKSELEQFEKKHGFAPVRFVVALDAIVIMVNKDNPIEELNLPQVDAIFSSTLKGGYFQNIKKWGDLGLDGIWKKRPIGIYGRNSASGTYGYFKKIALFKGDYNRTLKEQPGSASVVQSVSVDKYAIGYSGIGFLTSNVKVLNIAKKDRGKHYSPLDYGNILKGNYPLARGLNIYVLRDPVKNISPLVKEFLRYVLSKEGQKITIKDGYLPLNYELTQKYSKLLE